ncbi:LysR family transcriptional regulator [Corallincola platygyrae]|uniref:LysR family transcriptional regulator n=1 Tax=Corallincola platygyrae TaxID=1193278 RepID=A0ABW4XL55_9GAMM
MEIQDLEKFVEIARQGSLQRAAEVLELTPSALSKSLKRLETSLDTQLFDRVGKSLVLNAQGANLQPKAVELINLAASTKLAIGSPNQNTICRLAAPVLLQYKWLSPISRCLQHLEADYKNQISLEVSSLFEQEAFHKLKQGEVELALVTDKMLPELRADMQHYPLGKMTMQVAVGKSHPLAKQIKANNLQVTAETLLQHPFATPVTSPFCGERRGIGCDGWNEQAFPREIGWQIDDYVILGQLVKSGLAIAYLPDFLLREWQLQRVEVTDCPYQCEEQIYLIYNKRGAPWVKQLVEELG